MSVDHPLDPNPSSSHRSRLLAPLGAGAVLAAVGMVVGVTLNSGSADTLPVAQAAPSTTTTTATSSAAASSYKADSKGYVDTKARCDDSQIVMAYGRTPKSLVAICVDPSGDLQYRGVRLSDNASLKLSATRGSDGTVTAVNDGVTYSISPKLFLVSEGDSVIYRDSWIEFEQPGFSGSSTSSAATTSGSATTTVSTTTVTVTTSVTPTTSKSGG